MTLQPKIGETEARPERLPLEEYLERYRTYLRVTRGLSRNTLLAYGRDVAVFQAFLRDHGVWDARAVSPQTMTHYMDGLHRMGLAAVSRAGACRRAKPVSLLEARRDCDGRSDPQLTQRRARKALTEDVEL